MSTWSRFGPAPEPPRPWSLRLATVLLALIGLAVIGGCLRAGAPGGVGLGLFFWGMGAHLHLTRLVRPRPDKRVRRVLGADGEAIRVGLRPQLPLSVLAASASFVLVFGTGPLLIDSWPLRIACGAVAALSAPAIPASICALTMRGRAAVISARTLVYRGWSYDAEVAWDDVDELTMRLCYPRRPVVLVRLRGDGLPAISAQRRLLRGIEPVPAEGELTIPTIALDRAGRFLNVADVLRSLPASERPGLLAEGVGLLEGRVGPDGGGAHPGRQRERGTRRWRPHHS